MTNLKFTKRALLMSVATLVVCFAMLVGTTFAWFTSSVTSNENIIQTGTLKIGMYWANGEDAVPTAAEGWTNAGSGAIFNNDKWEPGYVEAKHLRIANEGTLALKYKLLIVPNGTVEDLADVIDVYFIEGATQLTREIIANAKPVGTLRDMIDDKDGAAHGALLPAGKTATNDYERVGEVTATLAFKMREDAGNEYQGMSIGTNFSIQLLATQYTFEEDSFDNKYDTDAEYGEVISPEDLAEEIAPVNGVITIDKDYIVNGEWVSIDVDGKNITIDGNGHTISNLTKPLVAGNVGETLTVKNLTIANSNIGPAADENGLGTGAFACFKDAYGSATFENCHLINTTVTSNNHRAGGFIAFISGGELIVKDCSVKGCDITGFEGAAAIVAHTQVNATITNTTVENTNVTATEDRIGTKAPVAGTIVGTANANAVVTMTNVKSIGNTVSNNNATAVYSEKIGRLVGNATATDN